MIVSSNDAANINQRSSSTWSAAKSTFTITALGIVALSLGANLAIFAVINSILLRPLPFPNADRLVTIFNTYPKAGVENEGSSPATYAH